MPSILHGTWLPRKNKFFVWGESLQFSKRRGSESPPHPFQTKLDDLPILGNCERRTLKVWLPAVGETPVPSPELVATGAIAPEGTPSLVPWKVTGWLVPINDGLDFLFNMQKLHIGADLAAWRVAALLAMEIVSSQQVMPSLKMKGPELLATWRPRPSPATAHKLAAVIRALPPLSRAFITEPGAALTSQVLVNHFVAAAVDIASREAQRNRKFKSGTPGGAWLAGLGSDGPLVKLRDVGAFRLYNGWKEWSSQSDVAGDEKFRITFRLELPEGRSQTWLLSYLLQASDDPSLVIPAAQVWRETGSTFKYLNRRFEHPQEKLLKGLGYASRLFPPINASLRSAAPEGAQLNNDDAFLFLKEAAPLLEQSGFGVLIPAWWTQTARLQAKARLSPQSAKVESSGLLNFESLVNFEWELTLAGEKISRSEFERLAALKEPLVQVRGQWVVMDPNQAQAALRFFDKGGGKMTLPEAMRLGLDMDTSAVPPGVDVVGVETGGWLRDLFTRLNDSAQLELLPVPLALKAELRPYQQRGYSWLAFLRQVGFGACLADDMGLGKTIQALSLLLREREQPVMAPALVVCPTSVVGNWVREIERFAPSLKVLVHRGLDRKKSSAFVNEVKAYDVVITSYPLLTRDRAVLTEVAWGTAILDEAQNIKNSGAKQAQAARTLKAANRVALTGTPVENRLGELWSIMAFLNPGYLGSEDSFRKNYARPIERLNDTDAAARLRKLTAPFVLRRMKTDTSIIADLPEKMEMKVYCPLTKEQATLYQAVVRDALTQVDLAQAGGDAMKRRGQVLAMLLRLKQICNHPAQFLGDGSPLEGRSGKLARLTEMLEEACAEGDRVLIFSQFAKMGALLQTYLAQALNEEVLFLYGGTKAKDRDVMVRRFQSPDGPKIFVLSLKAGGTGLNLTAASHVFHFDRWWNPAVENQATDRAFRIGQTRNVQVHKFICGGTLEDKIDIMIESKKALAESVLGAGEAWLTELNTDQLRDLVSLRQADAVGEV
jgi:SNF2 family DNA or RNA helicase